MATHDYILANQSGSSFRSDLNNALAAIVSQNSSATEPATKYAYQYWVDTSATPALIKQRNAANDAWITLAEVDGQTLAADGTNAKPGISFAADINTGLKRNAADDVSIVTGGTQAITVDSSQRVGIGTTSPAAAAHIEGAAPYIRTKQTSAPTDEKTWDFNAGTDGILRFRNTNDAASSSNNWLEVERSGVETGSIRFLTGAGAEKVRINSTGVGIGTTPATLFHIYSDQGGSGGRIKFDCNVSSGYDTKIEATDNGLELSAESNSRSIVFNTGSSGTERARVDGGGRFLLGTTNINPVSGNVQGLAVRVEGNTIQNVTSSNVYNTFRRNTNGSTHRFYMNSATHVGSISVTSTATAFNTSSDYRLKENIVDLDGAITRVKQLAPKRFNFIVDADTVVDGFIAHEAQTVVPEAVTGTRDETENVGTLAEWDGTVLETNVPEPAADELTWEETVTDEDGNETVETRTRTWTQTGSQPVHQGIDQSKLVPLLTAALQEAIAKIETLETKVAALEAAN